MAPGTASVLLLAGSAEATALAGLLRDRGIPVLASLAGHTSTPAPLPCPVRTGGFGGVDGLVAALRRDRHRVLVDATHPFAAGMAGNAAAAAGRLDLPRLRVLRPPWTPGPDDDWTEVDDLASAARALRNLGARRVFLALGRRHLAPFAGLAGVRLLARSLDPAGTDVPRDIEIVVGRPPFGVEDEVHLLGSHQVDTLVTRNSGAPATAAKLAAARRLGVRVVMVRRPPPPPGPIVADAPAALRWVESVLPAEEPLYPSRAGRGDE